MFERSKKEGSDRQDEWSRQETQSASGSTATSAGSAPARSHEVAVIGRSIRIDGDLQGEEDLRIEGDVNGTVQLRNNTLTIGQEGKIRANVYAKSVTVDGLMEGDLFGSERVSIRGNAQVRGNITAPRVSLEDGARFKGSIEMDPQAVEAALGSTTSKAAAHKGARGGQNDAKGVNKSGGAKADSGKANGASQGASAAGAPAGAKAAASKDPV